MASVMMYTHSRARHFIGSVSARDHCRISPSSHSLADCRKRRLNQASFVLIAGVVSSYVLFCLVSLRPLLAGVEPWQHWATHWRTCCLLLNIEHIQAIICASASSIHVLCLLRCHGLNWRHAADSIPGHYCLHTDLCATSTWWGSTTSDDRRRIEGFLRHGIRAGFYRTGWPTVENLVEDADDHFFRRVLHNEHHVLHPLLPERNDHGYTVRRRRHERTLTSNDDKRNFIYRQLHK